MREAREPAARRGPNPSGRADESEEARQRQREPQPEARRADEFETTPTASLSFDLDDKWSYMKTHGDPGWEAFPSYLETVVPRVLDFLAARDLRITFFIVGRDAAVARNHGLLRAIAAAGHEIGNHSFNHEPWLHLYSPEQIETELTMAEEAIEDATGRRPVGFRAPGYSVSRAALSALVRRGYRYDSSTLPSFVAPLARAYYFLTARFSPEERQRRRALGGTFREGFRPVGPYRWRLGDGAIIEIPVTTLPYVKVPIHVSYLLCLSLLSPRLARRYFEAALRLCRATGTEPSVVLHPTDVIGCEDTDDLRFFPGMRMPGERKLGFVSDVLASLAERFRVVTLGEHAERVAESASARVVVADF